MVAAALVTTAVAVVILLANVLREGVTGEVDGRRGIVAEESVMTLVLLVLGMTWDMAFGDGDLPAPHPC